MHNLYITEVYSFSEMTYNVSSGTLNPTIPYHAVSQKNVQLDIHS